MLPKISRFERRLILAILICAVAPLMTSVIFMEFGPSSSSVLTPSTPMHRGMESGFAGALRHVHAAEPAHAQQQKYHGYNGRAGDGYRKFDDPVLQSRETGLV